MNLPTRLVAVPRAASEVSDVLWASADPSLVEDARAVPTESFVDDLVRVGYSEATGQTVAKLPSPGLVARVAQQTTGKQWSLAVLENTCADDTTVAAVGSASRSQEVKDLSSSILASRSQLRSLTDANEIADKVDADPETLYHWHAGGFLQPALSRSATSRRERVMSLMYVCNPSLYDELVFGVVGALDNQWAGYLTRACAVWAAHSESLLADMTRGVLQSESSYLAKRGKSKAAESTLRDHGLLTVRNSSTTTRHATTRDSLEALRASGASPLQLATLVLNSSVPLSGNELAAYVAEAGPSTAAMFVTGRFSRTPNTGEVSLVLDLLDPGERAEVTSSLGDDTENLPWFADMVTEFPVTTVAKASQESIEAASDYLDETMGSDIPSWEFAMAMSGEWNASLQSLAKAATAMDALA